VTTLVTTLGAFKLEELGHATGVILPHEHIFVDLREPDRPGHSVASEQAVVELMAPELKRAKDAGVIALTDSTPEGVGGSRTSRRLCAGRIESGRTARSDPHRSVPGTLDSSLGSAGK